MNANRGMQLSKMIAYGPSLRPSMLGSLSQPLYTDIKSGLDFDKDAIGESIFLNGIDTWGDPKKKVGR